MYKSRFKRNLNTTEHFLNKKQKLLWETRGGWDGWDGCARKRRNHFVFVLLFNNFIKNKWKHIAQPSQPPILLCVRTISTTITETHIIANNCSENIQCFPETKLGGWEGCARNHLNHSFVVVYVSKTIWIKQI